MVSQEAGSSGGTKGRFGRVRCGQSGSCRLGLVSRECCVEAEEGLGIGPSRATRAKLFLHAHARARLSSYEIPLAAAVASLSPATTWFVLGWRLHHGNRERTDILAAGLERRALFFKRGKTGPSQTRRCPRVLLIRGLTSSAPTASALAQLGAGNPRGRESTAAQGTQADRLTGLLGGHDHLHHVPHVHHVVLVGPLAKGETTWMNDGFDRDGMYAIVVWSLQSPPVSRGRA